MKKQFVVYWNEDAYPKKDAETQRMEYFCNYNGFNEQHIEDVENLEIGQTLIIGDNDAAVTRMFDTAE